MNNLLNTYNTLQKIRCGMCGYTDGMCYTSNPPMCKCTITGKYQHYDHICDVPEYFTNKKEDNNMERTPFINTVKPTIVTVKGFDSLVNMLSLLINNDYKVSIKKVGAKENKYNENTHFEIEYYTSDTPEIVYRDCQPNLTSLNVTGSCTNGTITDTFNNKIRTNVTASE